MSGDDANGSSEDELAVERPRRNRKRPDRYGDWEYVRWEDIE